MKKRSLNLLILVILLGLGVSIYLTSKHFQIMTRGLQGVSFCNISETFDCDSVLMSRFAELGPFPLAGLGLLFFTYLLLPALYARIALDEAKSLLALPFMITILGLLLVVYLACVSAFVLKSFCLFCVSLYLVLLIVFLLLRSILAIPFSELGSFMKNYFSRLFGKNAPLSFVPRFFGNFLYAAIVGGVGLFILSAYQNKYAADLNDFDPQSFLDAYFLQKPMAIDSTGRPSWGHPGAPVKIIEFSDFECPFCKVAAANLKPRLKDRKNDVEFFFMNYPLDKQCNSAMQRDLHEHSCEAAKAAICAQAQGKFWPYHDLLFENQEDFSREKFKAFAKKAGLNADQLSTCMDSEATQSRLAQDIAAGQGANIEGTPMILINGRLLKDWFNPVKLNLVIDEELRRSKK